MYSSTLILLKVKSTESENEEYLYIWLIFNGVDHNNPYIHSTIPYCVIHCCVHVYIELYSGVKMAYKVKTLFPNPTMVMHILSWKVPDEMM